MPAPLPDELALDSAATRLLADAENAVGRLAGTTGRLVNPYLVASPLLHREAILSSRIEGTISTPEQLVLFEAGAAAEAGREREHTLEVSNYVRAMEHGLASPLPLSLRLVRELHRVLMTDVRGNSSSPGEFRRVVKHAEALLTLRERYHDHLRGARSFGHLERLVDHLFTMPSTTIGLAADYLGVTAAAASGHIRKLVDAGILKEWTGRRRDQVFVAPGILTFMRDRPEIDP